MTNTEWTTCGRKLLKDGETFFIRGINYAPTPIGKPGRLDMLGDERIFQRDLKHLRAMNANAVKTYDFYSYVNHSGYLDAAYNNGVDPIYTVFSIWIDQSLMESSTSIDSKEFKEMVANYHDMAKLTGGHPGVMGYSIGGEMNSITVINDAAFWEKFGALTTAVREGLAANNHAKKIITTTFVDDGGASFTAGEQYNADVDMWGSNVYQTDYPGSVIPKYMLVPGEKPLLVSEYGSPYASNKGIGDSMQLNLVADFLVQQTLAMQDNYELKDPLKEQVLVGGFVFEYSDEWWKSGNNYEHNLGLVKNGEFPLGYLSEEYFGLFSVLPTEEEGVDTVHPRPTVALLTKTWEQGLLMGEGVQYAECAESITMQQLLRTPNSNNSEFDGMLGNLFTVTALCAMIMALVVLIQTKTRRARYSRLSSPRSHGRMRYDSKSFHTPTLSQHQQVLEEEGATI